MKREETEGIGFEDRSDYWRKTINGKTVAEIADIITSFEQRATRDKLTGLINKDEFEIELKGFNAGARRRGSDVYILFLDFDDLKAINDRQGHEAGNELFKRGSDLLKSCFRPSDLLCRLHGDEFAAALEIANPEVNPDNMEGLIQRVVSNLGESGISISIGLHKFSEDEDLNDALALAERNMKLDKVDRKAGREFAK